MQHSIRPSRHHGQTLTPLLSALRRSCFGLALALPAALPLPGQAQTTAPQAAKRAYDIPAGPLGTVLSRFAGAAGVVLSFDAGLTAGRESRGLQGSYGIDEGFARLLGGSGLEAVPQGNGYLLRRVSLPPSGEATLAALTVTAARDGSGGTERSGSYTTPAVSRGKGLTLRETPQSVSVMTQQRIEDQGLTSLNEVLDQATGVTTGSTWFGSTEKTFYSRGFAISNVQIDGVTAGAAGLGYELHTNLLAYDHVALLRGADGLYAGTGEPGGTVSLARKRAPGTLQINAELNAARWNQYQGTIDVGGPLAFDGRVRGRLLASRRSAESFMDKVDSDMSFVYGTLEADITDSTLLVVGASREELGGTPFIYGLPRYANGDDIGLARSTAYTARWANHDAKTTEVFGRIEQKLWGDWQLNASAYRNTSEETYVYPLVYGAVSPDTGEGMVWHNGGYVYERGNTSMDLNASGSFALFGRRHKLLLGIDRLRTSPRTNWNSLSDWGNGTLSLHDGEDMLDGVRPAAFGFANPAYGSNEQRGLYGRLQLSLTDRLTMIVGARRGSFENVRGQNYYKESGIVTPYGALLYDIDERWTVYGSTTDIYKSQANLLKGPLPGTPLDPIEGRNHELGLKGELFDGRLSASLAIYRIERDGQATSDPAYPSTALPQGHSCCHVDDGRITSKGFDAEVSGEVLPDLQLTAGYTFNSNRNDVTSVRYHTVTPRHLFKLWGNWKPQAGPWSVGGGVTAQSRHYVSGTVNALDPATGEFDGPSQEFAFTQGGYAIWSLRIGYQLHQNASLAVNINNVFDKTYYKHVGNTIGGNWYGEPRNAIVSLRLKY